MALRPRKPSNEEKDDKTIEINAQMQGSLNFNDPVSLKINGTFNGELNTKGTLTIGSSAAVEASINGDNIVIAGRVNGDINAKKMLVMMPTAILKGNIVTPKLNIVEGAVFQGNCRMLVEGEGLLDIDEVAKYLEIDLKEIEELATSGKIPAKKSDSGWKFERNQIHNWASSGRVK